MVRIFAAIGLRMKLVKDGNLIAKKLKILNKTYVIYLKKIKEHVKFRFRLKKYDFLGKNHFLTFFPFF